MRVCRALLSSLVACLALGFADVRDCAGRPQITTALRAGVAGESQDGSTWQHTSFYGALYGDVLFGRESIHDIGVGPYLSVGTSWFEDVRLGGGATVLLPVPEDFPIATSVGLYAKSADPTWGAGVMTQVFWGLRSYNYHSLYELSAGVFAGLDYDLVGTSEHSVIIGVHMDNTVMALPFIIAINWFREVPED